MEFGILRFQQVPKDFQKNSTEIATMYPAPQHSHRDAE